MLGAMAPSALSLLVGAIASSMGAAALLDQSRSSGPM